MAGQRSQVALLGLPAKQGEEGSRRDLPDSMDSFPLLWDRGLLKEAAWSGWALAKGCT